MPITGFLPIIPVIFSTIYGTAAGSPGPFETTIPSGFIDSTSFALVEAGTTVTSQL